MPVKESTMYRNALALYGAMQAAADTEIVGEDSYEVWRGYITHLMQELNIPVSYYTPIKFRMEKFKCWTIIQAGARVTPSAIVLHRSPSEVSVEDWLVSDADRKKDLTEAGEYARLRSEVDGILKSLGGINIVEAFQEIERQFQELRKDRKD